MVLIGAMYTMDSGFTVYYPPLRKKLPQACGQIDVDALKQEILLSQPQEEEKAERMKHFLNKIEECLDENSPGSNASLWRGEAALRCM